MARLLALDYGKRRTGIAVSDPMQIIASGLCTVDTKELIPFLKKYFEQEDVELVLIGMPKDLKGEDTDATVLVQAFVQKFQAQFSSTPYKLLDERFTSKIARKTIAVSGLKKKDRENKALVDEISAVILLQGYMGL